MLLSFFSSGLAISSGCVFELSSGVRVEEVGFSPIKESWLAVGIVNPISEVNGFHTMLPILISSCSKLIRN